MKKKPRVVKEKEAAIEEREPPTDEEYEFVEQSGSE